MGNIMPLIGILCLDINVDIQPNVDVNNTFYISSSYVKWVESAGAKVVPIWANRTEDYYRDIMSKLNGVLFPNGQLEFNDEKYGKAAYSARKIYDIAVEMNDKGIYFPIWGICLGQQLLFYAASGGQTDSRILSEQMHENLPLKFAPNYRDSKMFKNVPDDILILMIHEQVTYNSHKYVVTKEILKKYGMTNDWNNIATNRGSNDLEFFTISEHTKYPFYGVISHPESIQFDYFSYGSHSLNAIRVSQYFANFFVEETRNNTNSFVEDQLRHLISNFPVTVMQPQVPYITEYYLFNDDSDYPAKSDDLDVKQ